MDPATLAILIGSVAASSAASVWTNQQNIKYAQEANDASVALANTAHQREVRDLQAAGLNPILSASGSGAAVPQLKVPALESPLDTLGNSASDIAKAANGLTRSEIDIAQSEASSAYSQARIDGANATIQASRNYGEIQAAHNDALDEMARKEALTGQRNGLLYDKHSAYYIENPDAFKTYLDLVQKYRNEIKSGKYTSSLGHQIYNDVLHGLDSGSSAFGRTSQAINSSRAMKRMMKRRP